MLQTTQRKKVPVGSPWSPSSASTSLPRPVTVGTGRRSPRHKPGGCVRVTLQHPETVGSGRQLFQTFTVHRNPVTKIMLSERHLISVCADNNHVRRWFVTRFRGMISSQPGSTPLNSFKILALESADGHGGCSAGNDIGTLAPTVSGTTSKCSSEGGAPRQPALPAPFIHVAAGVPPALGGRFPTTAFTVLKREGSWQRGSWPWRYLLTGQANGSLATWALTTAMEGLGQAPAGDLTEKELMEQLEQCELAPPGSSQGSLLSPSPRTLSPASTGLPATPPCLATMGARDPQPGAAGKAASWNAARNWCSIHQHQQPGPPQVLGLPFRPRDEAQGNFLLNTDTTVPWEALALWA